MGTETTISHNDIPGDGAEEIYGDWTRAADSRDGGPYSVVAGDSVAAFGLAPMLKWLCPVC
jgi:hypothetical protein